MASVFVGNRVTCDGFDTAGNQLDSATCSTPIQHNAPAGAYTVIMQFIIDTDGSLMDIKPLTNCGYGMEEEVDRVLRKGPQWIPAEQFGSKTRAYHKQPVTFVVSQR